MLWLKLAWKNLWRNTHRTAITISAIFFAVVLSVTADSLQDGVFDNFIKNMVSYYTGYIQVHQKGYWNHRVLDNALDRDPHYETAVAKLPNISTVAPRIESYALASFRDVTKGCMVVGVSPEAERRITALDRKVVAGRYFDSDEQPSVLLSEGLSQRLKLGLGDTLYLIGQGYHGAMAAGRYTIAGLVSFGSPELNDQLLFMPLLTAQEFFSATGQLTAYVIGIESDRHLSQVISALKNVTPGDYEVMSWMDLLPDVHQHIQMDKASMTIILGILYLLICFGIFGTLLMMVIERRFEMGMLVAIGMKKRKLAGLFLAESIMTVFIGSAFGLLFSIPVVWYLKEYPIRIGGEMAEAYKQFNFEPIFPASADPAIFMKQGLIVLVIGLVLSLYPVVSALRLNPVKAMRK